MAVFRVERTRDYTVMSNHHLKDKRLSLKAKGLLSQMLSLPDDWDYTLSGLSFINRESKDAIRTAVHELEEAGYIRRRQTTDESGKFSANEYIIYERPLLEEPLPENPTQLNTKKSNTQKSNTNLSKTHSFVPSAPSAEGRTDGMKDILVEREKIREQIEYEYICTPYNWEQVDEFVELILEVALARSPTIKIGREAEYPYFAAYARENGELEAYRASHKANIACRNAIDDAIRDNYRDNCLGSDAAKQVIAEFGFDRTLYVLAATVWEKEWDGRIARRNKDWALTVTVFDDDDGFGGNRNREFVVDQSHPGLVDLFVKQARREYLLSQPLTKEDIKVEAHKILSQFQDAREPNSPEGTHYMARVSPDFMARASSKDQGKLMKELPFPSLSLSTIKDRKGVFAFISKDEVAFISRPQAGFCAG